MNKNGLLFLLMLLIFTAGMGCVFADENMTADEYEDEITDVISESDFSNDSSMEVSNQAVKIDTKIESSPVTAYYKEKSELVSYLKDSDNRPIPNKKISITLNNKVYNKITDNLGKVVLKLNLKPDSYKTTIAFEGDESYAPVSVDNLIKVKKAPLTIKTSNHKTHLDSNLFFKAKIINEITKNPVSGIKVLFKVYMGHGKYKKFYATSDDKGIALLKKNFKVGSYKIISSIRNNKHVTVKNKDKATLTVKPTAEMGCTSLYLHVGKFEGVNGFRRDSTYAANIYIKVSKWNGRYAIKQYKTAHTYFFHSITTSDGWMIGNGGADNPSVNKAIEKLAGKMVKSGKIKRSYLKKIQGYERFLGIGHFAIKAPDGKYAVVWSSGIYTGKLKVGEYIKVPNAKSLYRHGTYAHFSKNPSKAAIKIAATDSFGVNRRDITAFHWKAQTDEGKTTSSVRVYGANDNGNMAGRSTGHLKDNIYFKNKFFSKNKLPKVPSGKLLGTHNFKSIDKLIKIQTVVKAPELTKNKNESKEFKLTVKNSKTNKAITGLKIKIKIDDKIYSVKTDSKGVALFKTDFLDVGRYKAIMFTNNVRYYVSAKSKIIVKE